MAQLPTGTALGDGRFRGRNGRRERCAGGSQGFTLIELMVVVVVATILLSIAIPSYQAQVLKSHRTEAKTAVLDLAGREERLFSLTNNYSQMPSDLGYPGEQFPVTVGNGYYTITVTAVAAPMSSTNAATYSITANATDTQTNDSQCASFTVDNLGRQTAMDSSGADNTKTCWN